MITLAAASLLDWYAQRRRRAWERIWRDPCRVQEMTLLQMVATASGTVFGRDHGFEGIHSVDAYQERVPLGEYLDFRPLWSRAIAGEADISWPGRPRFWVKTSGTMAGDKHIPVTPEAFSSHRKGGWDAFELAVEHAGATHLLGGRPLILGDSMTLKPFGNGCLIGDLSGLVVRRLPPAIRGQYSPGSSVVSISDWQQRIAAVASLAAWQDLRLLCGMPSWLIILIGRVAQVRREAGHPVSDLCQCWPNLRVVIHGGVAFAPYHKVFEERMGRPLHRIETYPASEGFVGLQKEPSGGLTLMLDCGIFYEDEPIASLDMRNGELVMETLQRIARRGGLTVRGAPHLGWRILAS
jgi:hypothetical protein